jgi:hypothetical protein
LAGFFFALFFGAGLGCGFADQTRLRASSNGIGSLGESDMATTRRRTVKTSVNPFNLSQEVYASIGEVAVAWSGIETLVAMGIALILKANQEHFIAVAANMNLSPQLDSLATLCHLAVDARQREELLRVLEKARKMNSERNKIIHGRWMQTEKSHIALRINARAQGTPSETRELMTAKSIRNFAKQVRELAEDLTAAYVESGLAVLPDSIPLASASTIAL